MPAVARRRSSSPNSIPLHFAKQATSNSLRPAHITSAMDPITAIGLASGILTFITFSAGLVKGWKQIHESGSLEENATLGDVIGRMETLHSRLIPPDHENKPLSGDAKDLCELAKDCQKVSDALLKLLGKMKSLDSARGIRAQWQNLSATWHSLVHEKDKLQLEEELSRCHQRLTAVLAFLTRLVTSHVLSLIIPYLPSPSDTWGISLSLNSGQSLTSWKGW